MSSPGLLLELPNIIFVLLLLAVIQIRCRFTNIVFYLLLAHFFLVFPTNHLLFAPAYMPDQGDYLAVARGLRDGTMGFQEALERRTVGPAGVFFASFPIPVIASVYSIATINYILFLLLFVFLHGRGVLRGAGLWFYLLYPSLALYTAVALRDILIFALMMLGFYAYTRRDYTSLALSQLPLVLIKFQNLAILIAGAAVSWVIGLFASEQGKAGRMRIMTVLILACMLIALPFAYRFGLEKLNLFRHRMWAEEVRHHALQGPERPITGVVDLGVRFLLNIPYFLFKPLPWQARNAFQLAQSFENLLVGAYILFLIGRSLAERVWTPWMRMLVIYLLLSLGIYGLVVLNFGTASRYRFPFLALFVVFYTWQYSRPGARVEEEPHAAETCRLAAGGA